MDRYAVQVERIRLSYEMAGRSAELQARIHVAALAVALTIGGTAVVADVTTSPSITLSVVAVVAFGVAFTQVRALSLVGRRHERAGDKALAELESLMVPEEDSDGDE